MFKLIRIKKIHIMIFHDTICLQETTDTNTALRNFIGSTLLPVCKELQSYVANALTYFKDFNLDDFVKNILKIQPDDEPQTTSVSCS